jgi:hypothetical protein
MQLLAAGWTTDGMQVEDTSSVLNQWKRNGQSLTISISTEDQGKCFFTISVK